MSRGRVYDMREKVGRRDDVEVIGRAVLLVALGTL
jgi:hypothetical protein